MPTKHSKKTAREGDVVELTEDLPSYNLSRGQRGIVIVEFDEPREAYDLEVEDQNGNFLGFAYSVKPNQFKNISEDLLRQGFAHLENVNLIEAEKTLKQAIDLNPRYRGVILNSLLNSFADIHDLEVVIPKLQFLYRLAPNYEKVRENLAIGYLNLGVEKAKAGDLSAAQLFFYRATGVESSPEIDAKIRENFAGVLTTLGAQASTNGEYENSVGFMRIACTVFPSKITRHNLGLAHAYLARYCMREGNHANAVTNFEAAEEAGLILSELLNDYGIALVFQGRLEEATRALERAIELSPDSHVLKENLAKLCKSLSSEPIVLGEISESLVLAEIRAEYIHIPTMEQHYQLAA